MNLWKQWRARRRSRRLLKAWARGWVWAMGQLLAGKSPDYIESQIDWNDPDVKSEGENWFLRGADTAWADFDAALQPCSPAPPPKPRKVHERQFTQQALFHSYCGPIWIIEDWLRELGLDIPISTSLDAGVATKRISTALEDADWKCYSWFDPRTYNLVVRVEATV